VNTGGKLDHVCGVRVERAHTSVQGDLAGWSFGQAGVRNGRGRFVTPLPPPGGVGAARDQCLMDASSAQKHTPTGESAVNASKSRYDCPGAIGV